MIPIPGTTSIAHLQENIAAADVSLDEEILKSLDELINQNTVSGERYPEAVMAEIDTENF